MLIKDMIPKDFRLVYLGSWTQKGEMKNRIAVDQNNGTCPLWKIHLQRSPLSRRGIYIPHSLIFSPHFVVTSLHTHSNEFLILLKSVMPMSMHIC